MEPASKESSRMDFQVAKANIFTKMATFILETSRMINSMELEAGAGTCSPIAVLLIEYFSHDGRSYRGEFWEGKRHGKGVYFAKGATYDGTWRDGVFWGEGVYVYANGDIYEGDFVNGKFEGNGRYDL
jgi:hypothetical protein